MVGDRRRYKNVSERERERERERRGEDLSCPAWPSTLSGDLWFANLPVKEEKNRNV
jgi:hypothetical protein